MSNKMNDNELYHYGVLGMRWGVRRKRPTLTKRRPSYRVRTKNWSSDAKEASMLKRKKVNEMSNSELRKLNERMQLEQNYSRLNPSTIQKGIAVAGTTIAVMKTVVDLYNNSNKFVRIGKRVTKQLMKK